MINHLGLNERRKMKMKYRTEDLIKSIEKLLNKKLNYEEKIYAKQRIIDLIKLTNNNAQAYVFLGQINVMLNQFDEAIKSFNQAILFDSLIALPHYELFDIYIKQCKYENALEQIKIYEVKSGIDCGIYINLLNNYLYTDQFIIFKYKYISNLNCTSKPILSNYGFMIDSINNKDYQKALKHVNVCIKLIEKWQYDIDLTMIKQILVSIKHVNDRTIKQQRIRELTEAFLNSNNCGIDYYTLVKLLKIEPDNINALILLIENAISLFDYAKAEECLHIAERIVGVSNNRINYLKNKLMCLKSQSYLSENNNIDLKKLFESTNNMRKIEELAVTGDIKFATSYGYDLFWKTNDSDYLYIVAKAMYNNGHYDEALMVFQDYIARGMIYLKQSYCYMFFINKLLHNEELANYYASLAYELSSLVDVDISLIDYEQKLFSYADNFSDYSIVEVEKYILGNNLSTSIKKKYLK